MISLKKISNRLKRKSSVNGDSANAAVVSQPASSQHGMSGGSSINSETPSVSDAPSIASSVVVNRASRIRKPSTGTVVFLFSLVAGVFAVYYSQSYIEDKVDFYKGQLEKTEPMVEVVVPGRRLVTGQPLREQDLLVREIPESYVDNNVLLLSTYESALGQELAFDVEPGKPLLWAHLEGGRTATFSGLVPEGARALTVRVDEINSISGFLQPKDRIDLLMTYGSGEQEAVFPLIQTLEVIATGLQTRVDKNSVGGKRTFSTITVNVTPDNAQKITLAQKIGKLTAVLRNPDDANPLSDVPMTTSRLLNKPKKVIARTKPKKPKPPAIQYIIGGA